MTIEQVKALAGEIKQSIRRGCFLLIPPVAVKEKGSGRVAHADSFDEKGEYPGTIHLKERGYWWDPEDFDPATEG